MKEFHGRASAHVDGPPDEVFDLITDVGRLPEWNAAIETVLRQPSALTPGAQWTVKMHPPHVPPWGSVSRLEDIDSQRRHFAYETRNADGNPSYTNWAWTVDRAGDSSEVSVSWDVYLKTLDRRLLAGPLRKRQLRREVNSSLASIAATLTTNQAGHGPG